MRREFGDDMARMFEDQSPATRTSGAAWRGSGCGDRRRASCTAAPSGWRRGIVRGQARREAQTLEVLDADA